MEFSDQAIIDILTIHRSEHGDPGKQKPKTLKWFTKYTIPKARRWAGEQQERDRKREERDAKRNEAEQRDADEQRGVAEIQAGDQEKARAFLNAMLDLPVHRLVQVGRDIDPAYKVVVLKKDGGEYVIEIPSLAAANSFAAFDRYVWRYTGAPLPSKAKKKWREVRTAFGKLIVVEDTGQGKVELMLTDLGEYFAYAEDGFFENYPVEAFPEGPPKTERGSRYTGWLGRIIRAKSEEEYRIALSLLALPQRHALSIPGIYFLKSSGCDGAETAWVVFKAPPLYDWLRRQKDRKFEIDEMNRRLVDAGFTYRDTAMERGVRLRRVWRGTLTDATVDDHHYLRMDSGVGWSEFERRCAKMTTQ